MRWLAIAAALVFVILLILVSWWALTSWLMSTHHDALETESKHTITKGIPPNDRPRRPATM